MCDCLCALAPATAGGSTLFAKSSDRPPDEPQQLEWMAPRVDRGAIATTYLEIAAGAGETIGFLGSRPRWAWGVEHGVSEAGVAIGNEAIYTTLDPRGAAPGLIGLDLVRLGLERGATAAGAVEVMIALLERHGQGGSGQDARAGHERPYWSSFLVADPAQAYVLETSGTAWAVERVERSRAISNRTTIPAFDAAHRHPRQAVERLVDPRWEASKAVLAAEPVTVGSLTAHARSHVGGDDGWTVCMHVAGVEQTTAAVVVELASAAPPWAWCLMGSPCASIFVPLRVGQPLGDVPAWERFAALDPGPSTRLALDALEVALDRDRRDDPGWNAAAWTLVSGAIADLQPRR